MTRTTRILLPLLITAASIVGGSAWACRYLPGTPSPEYTYFFDEVPTHLKAPVIAEVTIVGLLSARPDQTYMVVVARIERVIAGTFDGQTLNIVINPSSCGGTMRAGDRGIVAGDLRHDAAGAPELVAVAETLDAREKRKSRSPTFGLRRSTAKNIRPEPD